MTSLVRSVVQANSDHGSKTSGIAWPIQTEKPQDVFNRFGFRVFLAPHFVEYVALRSNPALRRDTEYGVVAQGSKQP